MNLKQQLAALQKELLGIQTKATAEGRDFTDDEMTEIEAKSAEIAQLKTRIERIDASEKSLKELIEFGKSDDAVDDNPDDFKDVPLGERFTKSGAYEAFAKANPTGVGQGSPVNIERVRIGDMKDFFANRKALTSPQARIQNIRVPMVDMVDRDELTLLDLISRGQTGGNFEYVQVVSVTRSAKIVPEATSGTDNAALKPVSEMSTQLADAKVYTYADGYDVTNQLLADAPAFASYMDQELRYSLDAVIEDKLLNGSGTSGEPKGILNTTGIQDHEFTGTTPKDLVRAVRRGITKVTRHGIGGRVTAVLISPEDAEEIDLMEDGNQRFYGQGPFGSGPDTLWGRPRVTSERIDPGTFLLGDFKQVALLDREGLSVLAFNQHKDYAQRNMTYVRAELRAAQVVWKPNRLVFGHRGTVEEG
ncbi:phage major capsid protein [Microbacterium hominis]|uniref:phage major capsid protein n=1 Tax=Microbacterium TaxID=33882 RepID=UPI00168BDCC3|nr:MULTISPECIES: phage major capsid protein [Microbacterium]QOC24834.1 phage major capsid protein [Microbacterium hominis]QOC28887.1 phage major capsid protein [Microbacterium hominis]QYF98914.1 phage major capsid protein [Microbacterium sp. PAMC21962]